LEKLLFRIPSTRIQQVRSGRQWAVISVCCSSSLYFLLWLVLYVGWGLGNQGYFVSVRAAFTLGDFLACVIGTAAGHTEHCGLQAGQLPTQARGFTFVTPNGSKCPWWEVSPLCTGKWRSKQGTEFYTRGGELREPGTRLPAHLSAFGLHPQVIHPAGRRLL
jgi:hypothetical protein